MGANPQHLSLDDLFAPLPDSSMLGGEGPFVINLSSSTVPISLPNNGISITPNTRVYQIRCVEDRNVRYRLRVGPFVSEAQANAVLMVVRDSYPAALTATASPADLESFSDIQIEAVPAPAPMTALAAVIVPAPIVKALPRVEHVAEPELFTAEITFEPPPVAPVARIAAKPKRPPLTSIESLFAKPAAPAPAPAAIVSAPVIMVPPVLVPVELVPDVVAVLKPEPTVPAALAVASRIVPVSEASTGGLSLLPELFLAEPPVPPPTSAAPAVAKAAAPPPVAPARAAPKATVAKSLLTSLGFPPAKTSQFVARTPRVVPKAAQSAAAQPVATVAAKPVAAPAVKAVPQKPLANITPAVNSANWPSSEEVSRTVLSLETTQTVRTLSTSEIEDQTTLRWFVVELANSDRAFDPDSVPNLDIFSAYKLYALETVIEGTVRHTLRLGFFGEAIAAQAVSDYLASYYHKPTVTRVSIAERERFRERRIEARKQVEATGRHTVIEITDERYVREPRALS